MDELLCIILCRGTSQFLVANGNLLIINNLTFFKLILVDHLFLLCFFGLRIFGGSFVDGGVVIGLSIIAIERFCV